MLLCRGMSLKELCLFLDGIEIIPIKNRQLGHYHNNTDCGKEICFFGMENEAFANDFGDVVAVFEVSDEQIRTGWGYYSWDFGGSFLKEEFRLPSYSKDTVKLLFWYHSDFDVYDSEADRNRDYVYGPYWYGMRKRPAVYTV